MLDIELASTIDLSNGSEALEKYRLAGRERARR